MQQIAKSLKNPLQAHIKFNEPHIGFNRKLVLESWYNSQGLCHAVGMELRYKAKLGNERVILIYRRCQNFNQAQSSRNCHVSTVSSSHDTVNA